MKITRMKRFAIALAMLAAACTADGAYPYAEDPDATHRKETTDWEVRPDVGECGNGIVDSREQCDGAVDLSCADLDDLFLTGEAGCTASCTWDYADCGPAECGNALHESGEECDEGRSRNLCPDYGEPCVLCLDDCTYGDGEPGFCGDGHLFFGEEVCDPTAPLECRDHGYESGELGCNDDCTEYDYSACVGSVCGNGVVDDGEACDEGADNTFDCPYGEPECEVCTPICQISGGDVSICGDGELDDAWEDCDPPGATDSTLCPGGGDTVCSEICKWNFDECEGGDVSPDIGVEPDPDGGVGPEPDVDGGADVGPGDVGVDDGGSAEDPPTPRDESGCTSARGPAPLGGFFTLGLLGMVRRRSTNA